MKNLFAYISLLLLFAINSCTLMQREIDNPPIEFDPAYLNQQIRLIAKKEMNSFKTSDPVALSLEYNSQNEIVFPNDHNIRMFIKQDGMWVEIKEQPNVIRSENKVVLSPNIPISYSQIVMILPNLADLKKGYYMRAYVFGDMTTSEGTKQVAAFVDFVLKP
jgi:hypothetical protein